MFNRFQGIRESRLLTLLLCLIFLGLNTVIFVGVWQASAAAMDNISTAAEAGRPDTVSQATWLQIGLGFTFQTFTLAALFACLPFRPFLTFQVWENLLAFALPISLIALTPVLGVEIPVVSLIVMTVATSLRLERYRHNSGQQRI
jgi:hypothetical protein